MYCIKNKHEAFSCFLKLFYNFLNVFQHSLESCTVGYVATNDPTTNSEEYYRPT